MGSHAHNNIMVVTSTCVSTESREGVSGIILNKTPQFCLNAGGVATVKGSTDSVQNDSYSSSHAIINLPKICALRDRGLFA